MRRQLAALALAGLPVLGFASQAQAQQPSCDTYSEACVSPKDEVKPRDQVKGVKQVKRTLPFTGGEFVLLILTGAGTVAGGTALVLAGRRGKHAH